MPTILQNHYALAVHNVRASAKFYVDVLDFRIVGEPEGWIFVHKDNCMIMLGECPQEMPPADLGSHAYFAYLLVDDADKYHAKIVAAGAGEVSTIEDKPWNMREFSLRTIDGHRLMIGHVMDYSKEIRG